LPVGFDPFEVFKEQVLRENQNTGSPEMRARPTSIRSGPWAWSRSQPWRKTDSAAIIPSAPWDPEP